MLRNLFCMFVAAVWTLLMFPLTLVRMALTFNTSASMAIVQGPWSKVLLWAGGATLRVRGAEQLDRSKPMIFVSNHQSTIDIPALFVALPVDFRFVAKKALMYVPFLGWYMYLAKFVFVDRGNRRAAIDSLDRGAAMIRGGVNIVMFPEGTRSETCEVLPFKKGPFALAVKAGVAIVPVAIEGSGKLMPKNSWNITPGIIDVAIGKPIDPAPFGDDREKLMRAVRAEVIALNRSLGGKGGNEDDFVAAAGLEGVSRRAQA